VTEFAPAAKLLNVALADRSWDAPPVNVEIAPTNYCNAKCPWCFYVSSDYKQHHTAEEIDPELLTDSILRMAVSGVKAITWTGGGDPSVYSAINNVMRVANWTKLKQGMFTNAYKPIAHPELLDWIRVTVTEKYIITKHVAEYARKTKVGVNFNLCTENEAQLPNMVKAARDAGVAYFQVRPALADRADLQRPVSRPDWLMDFDSPSFRIVLTDYKWDDYMEPHGYDTCLGHSFVPFLWYNGDVSVCAYHFGKPEFTFGNVRDGWDSVWKGERRRAMLEAGVQVVHDCQHCCKLHEVNKQLAAAREVSDPCFV
jgi:radical SAM protein with 4Fe4S-binding SPASM domain